MEEVPEKYRKDLAIIKDTAKQIKKDFNIEHFEIVFSGIEQLAFEELKIQLATLININYSNDKLAFQQLLYRVDIGEKEYKKCLLLRNSKDFENCISELIIRREFQKVLTRRFFSGK
jgi:hypothetical protein